MAAIPHTTPDPARAGVAALPATLAIEGVSKHFGGVYAVRDVSLTCSEGEIVGLIGPNGAGKTTLMNLISGTLTPDQGDISLGGVSLNGASPADCAIAGIARTFQNIRVFHRLTVRQNIEVAYTTYLRHRAHKRASRSIEEIMELIGLAGDGDLKAGTLPYGKQRRVEIARALALAPDILLLDEPAAGMNEAESVGLIDSVRAIRDQFGCGVVVIDHDLKFIMRVSERINVMHMGELIASGTPDEVRVNKEVIEVYLGTKSAVS
ncbi:ABC transporter ATP-binding protein [Acuticoccus mangrovi]|uniref:ABC transporter ATP-binding protein n=1 Tax=Acuticoccus mangrovi TaxID=2796142 RepID=UPI001E5A86CE|nr:ABC transporter ATP-binding protein [Acuticoccus mangrovi]